MSTIIEIHSKYSSHPHGYMVVTPYGQRAVAIEKKNATRMTPVETFLMLRWLEECGDPENTYLAVETTK